MGTVNDCKHNRKILALLETLTNVSSVHLEVKINRFLINETCSELVFLINLLPYCEEAVVQAIGGTALAPSMRLSLSEQTMTELVTFRTMPLLQAESLNAQIRAIVGEVLRLRDLVGIQVIPVFDHSHENIGQPVLLVCLKSTTKPGENVIETVQKLFKYCLTLLMNTMSREEETRRKQQCQSLLTVARKLFSSLCDINELLREIMTEAKRLTHAERCSLFLLDPDHMTLVAKVFDGASTASDGEVRIAKDKGVAGHVATTGKLLNIKNAYEHPLFYKGIDEVTGFKTRNILCFPITDETGTVGVAQLCNKMGGGSFNYFDEEVANAFGIYCGLSIMHSLVYKRIEEEQARNKLSNELMMYHMKISSEDVRKRLECKNEHTHPEFEEFSFSPRTIERDETICFVLKMFQDLGFIEHFKMKKETVLKFIMVVERGYRDTPYHNWMHAFSVSHFAYLVIKKLQLIEQGQLTRLEALAYLVSALCHDLDHRGTNNSFQQQSNSILASLYSSQGSVMERHHFSQTLCIINGEGCNMLEVLNRNDYGACLDLIQEMILSTDLSTHFKLYDEQKHMVERGYNPANKAHKKLFICLLMTCADLSDQTKEWNVVTKVAACIYEEFFNQGDLEKKMGKTPIEMMDREKAVISETQIEFLTHVCLNVYALFVHLFPEQKTIMLNINRNIEYWKRAKPIFHSASQKGENILAVLSSNELEAKIMALVNNAEKDGDNFKESILM